jgi:hypothetical protein
MYQNVSQYHISYVSPGTGSEQALEARTPTTAEPCMRDKLLTAPKIAVSTLFVRKPESDEGLSNTLYFTEPAYNNIFM